MARQSNRQTSVWKSLDWVTIAIYITLLVCGWISVCGASFTFGETDLLSLSTRSGMQIVWIGTSICLGFVLLMLDDRFYDTFAYIIYAILLLLLFATIFNPNEIKGSKSWIVLGPLRMQPAEFAKFATALAVAKLMSTYGFNMLKWRDFIAAFAVVFIPMVLIICQKETGSALVYLSFFLMFYREGMPGCVLFSGVAAVIYFVLGIKYAEVAFWDTPTSTGSFIVLLLIQIFTAGLVRLYTKEKRLHLYILLYSIAATLALILISKFVIAFDIQWGMLAISLSTAVYLVWRGLGARLKSLYLIAFFTFASVLFHYSSNSFFNSLGNHQKTRINVLLGLTQDLKKEGYNVHQSVIAIGSGGLSGKGLLNGTQTKLKFVPEQETDFIFCTVGEETGFVGSAVVLLLFLALILRLIAISERQTFRFGRIYGYCVLSIFLFHLFINVGMVLGLTPVIGIPLPFFSYGGSSLWGFTILLFIFLRIDASRNMVRT